MYKNGHNFATSLSIDVMFGSRMGFPAELKFLPYSGLNTRTAVARNPYVGWGFLFILVVAYSNKKLSYCWETVRRESMPRIAEVDVEMTT